MKTSDQKIVPCLWFDRECEEAMRFYVTSFSDLTGSGKHSGIISIQRYEEGMEAPGIENMIGKVITGIFEIGGYRFMALDGGPVFKINPSISFTVIFDPATMKNAAENEKTLWKRLSQQGKVFMDLGKYPFSGQYGWVQDKYGVSWQLFLADREGEQRPFIIPSLMFTGAVSGKAGEALNYYVSVFKNSGKGMLERYPAGMEPEKEGTVMYSDFRIEGQWFAAMDSARMHDFTFNEAISFTVNCTDQAEVDTLWEKLSHVPESEQCGWLKDKYGVSWQIVPERLGELLSDADHEKAHRVMNAMLHMKKINISELEYEAVKL